MVVKKARTTKPRAQIFFVLDTIEEEAIEKENEDAMTLT